MAYNQCQKNFANPKEEVNFGTLLFFCYVKT